MALIELGELLVLRSGTDRVFGSCQVIQLKDDWAIGYLEPGPEYPEYSALFREWTECINDAAFSCLDKIEQEIEKLGIFVTDQSGVSVQVIQVQIYDEPESLKVALKVVSADKARSPV